MLRAGVAMASRAGMEQPHAAISGEGCGCSLKAVQGRKGTRMPGSPSHPSSGRGGDGSPDTWVLSNASKQWCLEGWSGD